MDLDIRQSGNICVLKVKGPLKLGAGVDQLDKAVESALASGHIFLILDLEAMPVIDSSGIGAVVNALRQAKKFGGDAKLVNPSPFATKTFKMTHILNLFSVYPTEASAMEACGG
jgi:anti-sigma B factor antagonist